LESRKQDFQSEFGGKIAVILKSDDQNAGPNDPKIAQAPRPMREH